MTKRTHHALTTERDGGDAERSGATACRQTGTAHIARMPLDIGAKSETHSSQACIGRSSLAGAACLSASMSSVRSETMVFAAAGTRVPGPNTWRTPSE